MNASIALDTRAFDAALANYLPTTNKSLADVINQRAFNIALRGATFTKAGSMKKIAAYLNRVIAGATKRKGKKRQLRAKHLIVQAKRAKQGKPGLYGPDLRTVTGAWSSARTRSAGFLRTLWLPALMALQASAKFFQASWKSKMVDGDGKRLSLWSRTTAKSDAKSASPGNILARLSIGTSSHSPQDPARRRIISAAMQRAFDEEAREITRHVEAKMKRDIDRFLR